MSRKTKSKVVTPKPTKNANLKAIILTTVIFVIIGSVALWIFLITRPNVTINIDKTALQKGIQTLYNSINLPGVIVYDKIQDLQCNDSHSVGLSTRIDCSIVGYKLFKNVGSLAEGLQNADRLLTSQGFERMQYENESASEQQDRFTPSPDKSQGPIPYKHKPSGQLVDLIYYKDQNLNSFGGVISPDPMPDVTGDAYLYGIESWNDYFSCSTICPEPPSKMVEQQHTSDNRKKRSKSYRPDLHL